MGDICISLQPREDKKNIDTASSTLTSATASSSTSTTSNSVNYANYNSNITNNNNSQYKDDCLPHNFSKKRPHTISTTATETAVSSRPMSLVSSGDTINKYSKTPSFSYSAQSLIDDGLNSSSSSNSSNSSSNSSNNNNNIFKTNSFMKNDFNNSKKNKNDIISESKFQFPPPISTATSPPIRSFSSNPNPTTTNPMPMINHTNYDSESIIDASISRKRRWSAPENIADDDTNNKLMKIYDIK